MAKKNPQPTTPPRERAFLVGVELFKERNFLTLEDSLTELALLSDTSGLDVVGELTQKLDRPHAFELLNTLAVAFLDLDVHANSITGGKLGNLFVLFGFESLDYICHCLSSLRSVCVVFYATADYSTPFLVKQAQFRV